MLHGYALSLLEGAALTLSVAFLSLGIALALGLAGAVAKLSGSRAARGVAQAYTTVIRAVPDLVLMLLMTLLTATVVYRMQRLIESSGSDGLTGLPNRSRFHTLLSQALSAARTLLAGEPRGPRLALITSLRRADASPDTIEMVAVTREAAWRVATPMIGFEIAPNGTGDAVAALFTAHWIAGDDVADALGKAASSIFAVLEATAAMGERATRVAANHARVGFEIVRSSAPFIHFGVYQSKE